MVARLVHTTEGFLWDAATDGRSVAWTESADRYTYTCELVLLRSGVDPDGVIDPEPLRSGGCTGFEMSEGRLLVPDLEGAVVFGTEGGRPQVLALFGFDIEVLHLARNELLALKGSRYGDPRPLYRIALE